MKFYQKESKFKLSDTIFTEFDGYAMVYDEAEADVEKVLDTTLNGSFDGTIYWFSKEFSEDCLQSILDYMKKSVDDPNTEMDVDTFSSDLILYKKTEHGIFIVDTKVDFGSTLFIFIENLIKEKQINFNDINEFISYYDSHLIDNLHFGRDMEEDGNEKMAFFFKEGLITEEFLFSSLERFDVDGPDVDDNSMSVAILSSKSIDDFMFENCPLFEIKKIVNNDFIHQDYTGIDWIWFSSDIDKEDILTLERLGIKMSHYNDVVDYMVTNYFHE